MRIHRLGSTILEVSPFGVGLAALGRPGYINLGHGDDLQHTYKVEAMRSQAHQVLDAAWQAGVRYFDAARSYGRAEEFLGSWLLSREIAPQNIVIGSKWGYTYTADWQVEAPKHEVKAHTLPILQRQYRESQDRLSDHLDLYQIHSATIESGVLENRDVLEELARLKESGVAIGLSLSSSQQSMVLDQTLDIFIDGVKLFDTVQATWNLLEPSAGPMLQAAHNAGMGIIIKEALANGRLTARNTAPTFADKFSILEKEAQRLGTTIDALALAAVLNQPWVHTVLSGAATVEHLASNLKAMDIVWDSELTARLSELAETPEVYWQNRSNLAWN